MRNKSMIVFLTSALGILILVGGFYFMRNGNNIKVATKTPTNKSTNQAKNIQNEMKMQQAVPNTNNNANKVNENKQAPENKVPKNNVSPNKVPPNKVPQNNVPQNNVTQNNSVPEPKKDTTQNNTVPSQPSKNQTVTNQPAPNAPSNELNFLASVEQLIFQQVNAERSKANVANLSYNQTLEHYARIKSKDMGDNNYFDHYDLNKQLITSKMQADGFAFSAWGENIAYVTGMSDATQLAQTFMQQWMNSPGHRANILSTNYTNIGVGVYKIGDKVLATQEFTK